MEKCVVMKHDHTLSIEEKRSQGLWKTLDFSWRSMRAQEQMMGP